MGRGKGKAYKKKKKRIGDFCIASDERKTLRLKVYQKGERK